MPSLSKILCVMVMLANAGVAGAYSVIDGYRCVDLGLSVKWATCNIGAAAETDAGAYLAYGEMEAKSTYTEANSTAFGHAQFDYYDAAAAERGSSWRMPTDAEWAELIDHCKWTWTTINGVAGYIVRSRINDSEIFLPAAGRCVDSSTGDYGVAGCYASSDIVPHDATLAQCMLFDNTSRKLTNVNRSWGISVRAVSTAEAVEMADVPTAQLPVVLRDVSVIADEPTHGALVRNSECVDLGLSVRWARCNVGAASPEESGKYYAWGEIMTKSTYIESNYHVRYRPPEAERNMAGTGQDNTSVGWNVQPQRMQAPRFSDVARSQLGGSWRMPTKSECQELIEKCRWQYATLNGCNGYQIIGPNGNWIFLPAAGVYIGTTVQHNGAECHYWTATPVESIEARAWFLYSQHGETYTDWGNGSSGRCVRAVTR